MKNLFFIFSVLITNFIFGQIQVNNYGFVLKQYLENKTTRKEFISMNSKFCEKTLSPGFYKYDSKRNFIDLVILEDIKIDSLLISLPEFNKLKYKISYIPYFDEFQVVVSEKIIIKERFKFKNKNRKVYSFVFQYDFSNSKLYDDIPVVRSFTFPDYYIKKSNL
jgi:hypothetical protein